MPTSPRPDPVPLRRAQPVQRYRWPAGPLTSAGKRGGRNSSARCRDAPPRSGSLAGAAPRDPRAERPLNPALPHSGVNRRTRSGASPLYLACQEGHLHLAQFLVIKGRFVM